MSGFALTKLDILDELETIKACTAYKVDGKVIAEFPPDSSVLERCEPVYEEVEGWRQSTAGIQEFGKLPGKARSYINWIEDRLGIEAHMISTGQRRNELIVLKEQFS